MTTHPSPGSPRHGAALLLAVAVMLSGCAPSTASPTDRAVAGSAERHGAAESSRAPAEMRDALLSRLAAIAADAGVVALSDPAAYTVEEIVCPSGVRGLRAQHYLPVEDPVEVAATLAAALPDEVLDHRDPGGAAATFADAVISVAPLPETGQVLVLGLAGCG